MRTPRLYIDAELEVGASLTLDERAHRHAVQVLRLGPGDTLCLFNGLGGEYLGRLTEVKRHGARVEIERYAPVNRESPLRVLLAQGIAKGDHMDYSLQKATELGVTAIQPVITRRTVGNRDSDRLERRLAHWRGVVLSACEQSGRTHPPEVHAPMRLSGWLQQAPRDTARLVLVPGDGRGLIGLEPPPPAGLCLLIGPEGGLSEDEIEAARSSGFVPVRLGGRVLRTETAAAAALTAVQLLWGDLGR